MPQGNAELMEREGAAVRHLYVVLNVFLRGREIAGSTHLAGAVPGEHLDGGILRKNASSDLHSNGDAKVNLEHPHSPPPASLPFPEGGQSLPLLRKRGQANTLPDVALWEGVDSPSARFALASHRLLAPDHVARRMRETDDARAINFAFQRGRVNRTLAHDTGAARSPAN